MSKLSPAKHVQITQTRRDAFLCHLSECGNVTASADAVGVSRVAFYNLRKQDKAFKEAWDEALARYGASLEKELHQRVFEGQKRPIFQRGELVGHEVLKFDRLLELALKAHIPERYSEKTSAKVDHEVKGGVLVVPAPMTVDEWERQERERIRQEEIGGQSHPSQLVGNVAGV